MLEVRLDLHITVTMRIAGIIIQGETPDPLESGIAGFLNSLFNYSPGFFRLTSEGIFPVEGYIRADNQSELYLQLSPSAGNYDGITTLCLQQNEVSTFFNSGVFPDQMILAPAYTISFALRSGITQEKKAESRIRLLSYSIKKSKEILIREISLLVQKSLLVIANSNQSTLTLLPEITQPDGYLPTSKYMHRRELLFSVHKWNVGIIDLPIQEVAAGKGPFEVKWLAEAPSNDFKADPFGLSINGNDHIFFEYFDANRKSGFLLQHINETESDFLRKDYHLSYPFAFTHEANQYLIPEAADNKNTVIYQLKDGKPEPIAEILDGFQAVDPTVFEYKGRWWLFCTSKFMQGADLRLYIFHAIRPEGPWIPHTSNPVKTDICTSRPGGTPFQLNDKLIRPAQDSSTGYGSAIHLMEIIELSPETFHETIFRRLGPENFNGPYKHGVHTISSLGNKTLIDGKRKKFTLQPFFRQFVK